MFYRIYKRSLYKLFSLYKRFISPIIVINFGHACRFQPTCSEYAHEAIHKYGIVKGGVKSIIRIVKCNPFSKIGYDPVK